MFSSTKVLNTVLLITLILGLSACESVVNTNTPTPGIPTFTPPPPTATPPPSAAVVNGEYILITEYESELARYKAAQSALGQTVSGEDANRIVLEDMIAQTLLAQAAREAGFVVSDADLQARTDALGSADVLSAWQSAHGYDAASFQIALKRAIESAWMRDKIIADVPATAEQIHLRQILTYNEENARAASEQIKAGSDFDEIAALYDPITMGELGWIPRGYLLDPKADEAVFALQAGQYSDVVATEAGFHIFKAIERGEHALSPDALLTVQEVAVKKWIDEKRASSEITLAP
jgi:parvulin-like peptidyl-prolyl isomerase